MATPCVLNSIKPVKSSSVPATDALSSPPMPKPNLRPQTKRARKTRRKKIANAIEILLLLPSGAQARRRFLTETEASEYLKATHATEAPLSFDYVDGSPVPSSAIERIYARVFDSLFNHKLLPPNSCVFRARAS